MATCAQHAAVARAQATCCVTVPCALSASSAVDQQRWPTSVAECAALFALKGTTNSVSHQLWDQHHKHLSFLCSAKAHQHVPLASPWHNVRAVCDAPRVALQALVEVISKRLPTETATGQPHNKNPSEANAARPHGHMSVAATGGNCKEPAGPQCSQKNHDRVEGRQHDWQNTK
jgi:hypothetical protein